MYTPSEIILIGRITEGKRKEKLYILMIVIKVDYLSDFFFAFPIIYSPQHPTRPAPSRRIELCRRTFYHPRIQYSNIIYLCLTRTRSDNV